ncbi:MAG: YchJ family protein [Mycobacterium sp.]
MRVDDPCPFGTGEPFGSCCLPLHAGERHAQTAKQLMRSRFSAYAVGDSDYLWRTWHSRTRPGSVTSDAALVWTRLEIIDVVSGGPGDESGEVEFRAHYVEGVLHERSRFALRARRWFYVDGELFE